MPSELPKVFVVTPSLNQGAFISETIESVLAQDYPNIDYFVADGGSADGTIDILRTYRDRVRWESAPDGGQAAAIDKAFRETDAEYVTWLNSDDRYLPNAISMMVRALEAYPGAPFVYGHANNIDQRGRLLGPARQVEAYDRARLRNDVDFIVQPASLIRRAAYIAAGGIDTELNWSFDYDLWLKLTRHPEPPRLINQVLAVVTIHASAKTSSGGLDRLVEIERMALKHGRTSLPRGFAARMAVAQLTEASRSLRRRSWTAASDHLFSGLRHAALYAKYRIALLPHLSHFKTAARASDLSQERRR